MIKEKIILFDIDSTLFDTQKYIFLFLERIAEELLFKDLEAFSKLSIEAYKENKLTNFFDPDIFIPILSNKLNKKLEFEKIKNIILDEKLIESCLYPETIFALQKLAKDKNLIIGIFSAGKTDIQLLKIKTIRDFINEKHIHIVVADKKNQVTKILEKYRKNIKIYLIDDLLEILKTAKSFNPEITVIWSKRGRHMNDQKIDNFTPDFTIASLLELVEIVNKI